jgi:hypothetical protein
MPLPGSLAASIALRCIILLNILTPFRFAVQVDHRPAQQRHLP